MKFILFILFFTASVASSAIDNSSVIDNKVQQPKVNPYAFDKGLQKMQVDPSKAEQVKKLLIENRAKRREIMEAARAQINALEAATEQQIADILTDEELQIYDKTMDAQQQVFEKSKQWRNLAPNQRTSADAGQDIHVSKL